MAKTPPAPPAPDDDEYRKATKTVVDDAMRTDILGPNLVRVLKDHKPANDLLHQILHDCIASDTEVKKALAEFVDEHTTKKKGKWIDRAIWIAVGAVITGVIVGTISLIFKAQQPATSPSSSSIKR